MVSQPANVLGGLKNTRGRVVATIAYSEDCAGMLEEDCRRKVVELYSYDDEGRVRRRYKAVPGLQTQTVEYHYDLQGRVTSKLYYNGTTVELQLSYSYDSNGRLASVKKATGTAQAVTVAEYAYAPHGPMTAKSLKNSDGTTELSSIEFDRNIRGWTRSIEAPGLFGENLYYHQNVPEEAEQYNGNIAKTQFSYQHNGIMAPYSQQFAYDRANRLTGVSVPGQHSDIPGDYTGQFTYDNVGRIETKNEGGTDLGTYEYDGQTSRLVRTTAGSRAAADNFDYDPNGNMIQDKSKHMQVVYDYRNLPVEFIFYENPDLSGNVVSRVKMLYDAGGNRVLKQVFEE